MSRLLAVMIAATGILAVSCDEPPPWGDPNCEDDGAEGGGLGMFVYVGLFANEPFGEPLCIPGADITIVQGERFAIIPMRTTGQAQLLMDGIHMTHDRRNLACNLYFQGVYSICDPPLEYSVRVTGCDPVDGIFTWGDNYTGQATSSWQLPIILTCTDPPIDGTATGGPFPCDGCVDADGGT